MALANIAVILAKKGLNVLAVDWDLEAPGLPRYFSYFKTKGEGAGLLPLLIDQKNSVNKIDYREYLRCVQDSSFKGRLDLLASGHEHDSSYSFNLQRFDWQSFYNSGGGDFFETLRNRWIKDYDVVLIDSRTGLTDSGGICTIQMPDIVVALFTANYQSLYGVRDVMRLAQEGRQRLAYDRMPLSVVPIPSRFGTRTEFRESKKWIDEFENSLKEFFEDWLPVSAEPSEFFEKIKIPQIDYFSFGERLAVIEDSSINPEGMMYSYKLLSDLLASNLKDINSIVTVNPNQ